MIWSRFWTDSYISQTKNPREGILLLQMFLPPGIKSTDERGEAQATLGQAVLYPRRDFGVDFAENKSILFEFTEGLDEHLFAYPGDELL